MELTYQELLQTLQDTGSVDFKALREAYTQTAEYAPDARDPNIDAGYDALHNGDYDKVIELAETMLEKNYLNVDAHMLIHLANKEQGDAAASKKHKDIVDNIMRTVVASGDGKSYETAYHVISLQEEYAYMMGYGLTNKGQRVTEKDGRRYDVIEVENEEGRTEKIYFDITLFLRARI